jgi:protein SSD1
LAENSDDEHLKKVHRTAEQTAMKMEVVSRNVNDEHALFEEDDDEDDEIVIGRTNTKEKFKAPPTAENSKQRLLSIAKVEPIFEGLKTPAAGHKIQEIKELMSVPVRLSVYSQEGLLLISKLSGYRHSRSDQEPTGYQGLQCQPLRPTE